MIYYQFIEPSNSNGPVNINPVENASRQDLYLYDNMT